MKKEKGITIISLVITIIVMAIIATSITFGGLRLVQLGRISTFAADMKIIQGRVDVIYEERKTGNTSYEAIGQDISLLNVELQEKITTALQGKDSTGYKYYNKADLRKLGLEELDRQVLINFDTRSVISVDGIEKDGTIYYTTENLDA